MRNAGRLVACCAIAAALSTTYAKETVESRWLEREVTIDGAMDECNDAMAAAPGDVRATLGVINDGTHLYLCLRSWDGRTNFQAASHGLILRMAPKGKGAKGLAIRFPVGVDGEPGEGARRPRPPMDGSGAGDREAREAAMKRALGTLDVLEILENGKDHGQRLALDATLGFHVAVDLDAGMLIYELKIPLKSSAERPYALDVEPGEMVVVTFETPKIDIKEMQERMGRTGGGRGGGGMRGSGGGGGPRGGGMRGGGGPGGSRPDRPEPFKIKAKIQLAAEPK